ncbi:MAG: hypothetical protein EVA44_01865 [Flavobacteriales bacterium]|jgi:hypothetical protein|nr:DUF5683 domain-containing protein [Flavobacteriaceae bacterium]RZP07014.1 MAG: hypothetical protein EVA44_01865 [Flavobacteriales bacterium]|tara:strand:- start:477 stop:1025 length:549 start_codon:yes stop_codon:yes gene_type:complete
MIYRNIIIIILFLISTQNLHCQTSKDDDQKQVLGPAKAAFYSAVLPGLGQVYNKKYWKVPIVYGALAGGVYYFNKNNNLYHKYRDAYKRRLAGFTDDEFYGNGSVPAISNDGLIRAQKSLKRNKELSILVTIGIYALNIIDANVDAHLLQYNLDDNLSLSPKLNYNEINSTSNLSLSLKLEL